MLRELSSLDLGRFASRRRPFFYATALRSGVYHPHGSSFCGEDYVLVDAGAETGRAHREVVPQGKHRLEQYLVILMNEHDGERLSARMRMLVADIRAQWQ